MLFGSATAKHDRDDDDAQDNGKRPVTVIDQRPVDRHVVVVQRPSDRVVVVDRDRHREDYYPREKIIVREGRPQYSRKIYITDDDARIIHQYYYSPGHHKRHRLPPGWRKRIIIGRPMPEDIVVYRVPEEIEEELPPLPHNYIRFMIGSSLFVKDTKTNIVVDAHFGEDY
jgi:hypothetical protein